MAGELILFNDRAAAFAPQYFGSVQYYARLCAYGKVFVDTAMAADKRQKSVHRCTIVDTHGEINLTVPIAHLQLGQRWHDVSVSGHGEWWKKHVTALESAYGRTPFYEYYAPEVAEAIGSGYGTDAAAMSAGELAARCDRVVRRILGIDNEVTYGTPPARSGFADYRQVREFEAVELPYYQVRVQSLGFRAGLTVLDLIFNLGPEAAIFMKRAAEAVFEGE